MIEGFRKGDIKSMTIGYFVAGITQACLWIGYGACLKDFFVYFPNLTCATLFLIYLNMLIYVKKKYNLFYLLNPILFFELFIIIKLFFQNMYVIVQHVFFVLYTNQQKLKL